MRSLFLLSTIFGLLAAYLEHTTAPGHLFEPTTHSAAHKVIRNASLPRQPQESLAAGPRSTTATPVTRPAAVPRQPLNLSLPGIDASRKALNTHTSTLFDLFNYRGRAKVTYNAELVFDRETGEDITGGKVHIKIPLT